VSASTKKHPKPGGSVPQKVGPGNMKSHFVREGVLGIGTQGEKLKVPAPRGRLNSRPLEAGSFEGGTSRG
jgi:hypothetical protein